MKCVMEVFASVSCCLLLLCEAHAAMPCVSNSLELSLDNAIHISDVVLTGRVTETREGDWGTHTAAITYYYAYKSDRFLLRLGFGRIQVKNFQSAVAVGEGALFFLTREPSKDLALLCMAPLSALLAPREMGFSSMYEVLERVRTVGEGEDISATNCTYWYTCMRVGNVYYRFVPGNSVAYLSSDTTAQHFGFICTFLMLFVVLGTLCTA